MSKAINVSLDRSSPVLSGLETRKTPTIDELLCKIKDVKELQVDNVLQAEILVRLMQHKSTGSDLATCIFPHGTEGAASPASSHAEYMRIVRSLGALEGKGLVARALFGKEKPYHLTGHGQEAVTAALRGSYPSPLLPRRDLVLYAAGAGITSVAMALTVMEASTEALIAGWLSTGLVLGMCLTRFVGMLRRVL